jgi:predicted double-glycine peptidase
MPMKRIATLLFAGAMAAGAAWAAETPPLPPLAGASVRVPVKSIRGLRNEGVVLQQYDFSCGSAALATLLTNQYGVKVDEQTVLREMFDAGDQDKIQREGFSLLDMKQYLERHGYQADGFEQPLEKLAEARIPAIVLIDEGGYHHFVVVKGLAPGRVLVGDPARGTRLMTRAQFEQAWVGKLLFLIHSHTQQARFNLASDWRAAPMSPLASGVSRDGMPGVDLPKHMAGDF